ncbi:uncharacterized protein BDZ99DRAFT_563771 [Mytilinidion resinicola]|uniref:Uncharacterized protein n=1 Tax=Mytilinidion resinicola TaxID=574789 RepID=A0A6A6YRE6_9PEZI|nr:uncharacterized protein BDZ99DRAFT_563771 [Mytilinidion resinicola]KAF2810535.1 hypothetical protein BDZ99DRAFT_563771 [Mytilinidion resinicola]
MISLADQRDNSFFQEIQRISADGYVPTSLETWHHNGVILECPFFVALETSQLNFVPLEASNLVRYTTAMIFIDLSRFEDYEQIKERLWDRLREHSNPAMGPPHIMVIFGNIRKFKQKLSRTPISNYLPNCTGGENAKEVVRSLIQSYNLPYYGNYVAAIPYLYDCTEPRSVDAIIKSIETDHPNVQIDPCVKPSSTASRLVDEEAPAVTVAKSKEWIPGSLDEMLLA